MLDGYKTYIIGVAMFCYALGGLVAGKVPANAAIQVFLEACALMGLRAGLAKK